jgi:hypothetical protein
MTVRLNGSTSGYTELDAPAVAGNNNIKLPSSNGAAFQIVRNGANAGETEFADKLVLGTQQSPAASATNITFTGIPSWVKRITVSWSALTMQSGYANLRLGTSGGLKTSGYGTAPSTNYSWLKSIGGGEAIYNNYTDLGVYFFASIYTGSGNVSIVKMSSTAWMISGMCLMPGASYVIGYQAYQVLASDLTQLALVGDGSSTFSAGGNINILYE